MIIMFRKLYLFPSSGVFGGGIDRTQVAPLGTASLGRSPPNNQDLLYLSGPTEWQIFLLYMWWRKHIHFPKRRVWKRQAENHRRTLPAACWYLVWLFTQPSSLRWYFPSKRRWISTKLNGGEPQKFVRIMHVYFLPPTSPVSFLTFRVSLLRD
jgi:hypothetical protein